MAGFSDAMWRAIAPIHAQILEHPFNAELAAGTLSRERFGHYMLQDAHYLGVFARVLALLAATAPAADAQIALAGASRDAIVVERSLHEGFFAAFGIGADSFAASRPAPTCQAYGDFLVSAASLGGYAVGLAAVLPCFHIYLEVGTHLYGIAAADNPYQRWIDTYRDETFAAAVGAMRALADAAHADTDEAGRRLMRDAYTTASRYEWMFWDAAYRTEAWPV